MVPIEYIMFIPIYYMVTFFFLNDSLILEYNVLMFLINLSMLSRISLIKIAVLIYIIMLDYLLCFSSETSTLISFGIIYSKSIPYSNQMDIRIVIYDE